jgi:DNA-binding SARP family transcriptional activator
VSSSRLARLERENRRLREQLARQSGRAHGAPIVELQLLGVPAAAVRRRGRRAEVPFRLRRSLLALAYLALAPSRRCARETLAEALWPEAGRETLRRNFHPVISLARQSLRRATGAEHDFVVQTGGVYALDDRVQWTIDVAQREARIQRGDAAAAAGDRAAAIAEWSAAWRLYRGALLLGADAPWADDLRERLRDGHLGLLRRLAETLAAEDRGAEAMDVFRAVLVEDPLQESAHLALMEVYARQGRRDLVRRQYERLCDLLRAELGSEPLLRTTLEYHTLMA